MPCEVPMPALPKAPEMALPAPVFRKNGDANLPMTPAVTAFRIAFFGLSPSSKDPMPEPRAGPIIGPRPGIRAPASPPSVENKPITLRL